MRIAVASGKGGTGKTTVATSLALALVGAGSVEFLDCDVEEPNAHLFLKPEITETTAVHIAVPQVDAVTGRKRIVLGGDVPSQVNPPSGCHFHPRCPQARPECAQSYPDPVVFSGTHMCRCILYDGNGQPGQSAGGEQS